MECVTGLLPAEELAGVGVPELGLDAGRGVAVVRHVDPRDPRALAASTVRRGPRVARGDAVTHLNVFRFSTNFQLSDSGSGSQ